MGDVGYRGVSAAQDGRYRNKEQLLLKKLASSGQFPSQFEQKVMMDKVNLEVMKPWISDKVSQLLGFEDDVVVEYIHGMLEDPDNKQPDPKKMQLSLTGFLESNTPAFMAELWLLLLSAQKSLGGIPQEFVDRKKQEMREAREKDANAIKGSRAIHDHRPGDGRSNHRPSFYDRGGSRGGRGRGGHFNDRGEGGREFIDKNGNRTDRVQDRGWGARSGQKADASVGERDGYRNSYQDERRSYRRDRSYSPDHQRDSRTQDKRRDLPSRPRSPSRSPGPANRRAKRSVTPILPSRRARRRSRSYSVSLSPQIRRKRDRSPTYSRSPSPRRRPEARSRSRNHSPPATEASKRQSRSRTRSPPL